MFLSSTIPSFDNGISFKLRSELFIDCKSLKEFDYVSKLNILFAIYKFIKVDIIGLTNTDKNRVANYHKPPTLPNIPYIFTYVRL